MVLGIRIRICTDMVWINGAMWDCHEHVSWLKPMGVPDMPMGDTNKRLKRWTLADRVSVEFLPPFVDDPQLAIAPPGFLHGHIPDDEAASWCSWQSDSRTLPYSHAGGFGVSIACG